MSPSAGWFLVVAAAALGCMRLGYAIARRSSARARGVVMVCVLLLMTWGWLSQCPAMATRLLPIGLLAYLEGVAPVPVYMAMVGALWGAAGSRRQRRFAALTTVLGVTYLMINGMWMLQASPREAFASRRDGVVVRQSSEYSCVAAACATALNQIGVPTTEARMVELTHTRPGTGSTLIRALHGLSNRLEETGGRYRARMIAVEPDSLAALDMPALTTMRYVPSSRHMVTILSYEPRSVVIADPDVGEIRVSPLQFERYFVGDVIVFEPMP